MKIVKISNNSKFSIFGILHNIANILSNIRRIEMKIIKMNIYINIMGGLFGIISTARDLSFWLIDNTFCGLLREFKISEILERCRKTRNSKISKIFVADVRRFLVARLFSSE